MKISVLTPSIRPEGLEITRKSLMLQILTDFEWLVDINWTGHHDLNASYNRLLRRAKGELVVSLQDYIYVRSDYLQRFWQAHEEHPRAFITAPVGKVDNLNYSGDAKWDWRAWRDNETKNIRPCEWNTWECDSACAPLSALKEIGGFDEALDGHWSADNVNVGKRAQLAGYEFLCLFDNPAVAYNHDKFIEHPFRTDIDTTNTKRMAMFEGGMQLKPL